MDKLVTYAMLGQALKDDRDRAQEIQDGRTNRYVAMDHEELALLAAKMEQTILDRMSDVAQGKQRIRKLQNTVEHLGRDYDALKQKYGETAEAIEGYEIERERLQKELLQYRRER